MTAPFAVVTPGSASPGASAPTTPKNLPHTGGEANPSAEALRAKFGAAVERVDVVWGETTVIAKGDSILGIVQWLHDDPSQQYDYLSDVTAVEHRDADQAMDVVWHLRSLPFRRFLRLKVRIPKGAKLEVDSVWPVYKGADWLERETYDMFGINFRGHPDLRRILMWESYKEGYPLRKDFPLRGRFSRSEQLRQSLDQDPEARYSMEELSVADAFQDLPPDMRERLASGEKTGE